MKKGLLAPIILSFISHIAFANDTCQANTIFNVGAGIYDITGSAAEQGMMGYAMLEQKTSGIYQRLWARAFVIESPCNQQRVVFVNADLGQVFQGIKQQVVKKLQAKYGNRYSQDNVLLTATHTHSGPGGYSTYAFYNLTTWGFSRKNFDVIVEGIVAAIARAENNITPAQIRIAKGEVLNVNNNRSPTAYQLNPLAERNRYSRNVDTEMTLIRFDSLAGKAIGTINWFPIHGTSMNNKNRLINGDNKGYAEYIFEKSMGSDYGPSAFVAAFAQANAGDVTPNPYGEEGCSGDGGLKNIERAGKPQFDVANELYNNASEVISGGVDYRHSYVEMGNVQVNERFANGSKKMTCPAAIGVSMLAGTQDGEGLGKQGLTCDNIQSALAIIACEMTTTTCQGAKPIAITTAATKPYPWTPQVLPMQVVKIGNLVIAATPMELTTMVGRRLKDSISKELSTTGNNHIVVSALSNAYAGYIATPEEYQLQRYEGASTHFGPWTAAALQQLFAGLTHALVQNEKVTPGPEPLDLLGKQSTLQTEVLFDTVPVGKDFGSVYQNVKSSYKRGEKAEVVFWGAHPKNNYHTQGTFLEIQQLVAGKWQTIRNDNDWDTEYHWRRESIAQSHITIVWRIPSSAQPGQYRIVHYGDWKHWWSGRVAPYTGYSGTFSVS